MKKILFIKKIIIMKTEKDSPCLCRDDDDVFTGFYQHGIFPVFGVMSVERKNMLSVLFILMV